MSGAPKEGIYLDATLRVLGQQIEERVDELERRRRRRTRFGMGALAVAAVAGGSVAAAAIVTAADPVAPPEATTMMSVAVRCAEPGAMAAFFSADYRIADTLAAPAHGDVCAAARELLAARGAELAERTPEQLIRVADDLLTGLVVDRLPDDGVVPADPVRVDAAAFGALE